MCVPAFAFAFGETAARVRGFVISVTEQVIQKTTLLQLHDPTHGLGTSRICRDGRRAAARCGGLWGGAPHQLLPLSLHLPMELRHNPTWLPYLLHRLLYLGEAPLNTALSRSSFETPKSWEPTCAWRETATALCKAATAMASKGKRERLFKRKVTRWQAFRHILTTTTTV